MINWVIKNQIQIFQNCYNNIPWTCIIKVTTNVLLINIFIGANYSFLQKWMTRSACSRYTIKDTNSYPLPVTRFGPTAGPAFEMHIKQSQSSQIPPGSIQLLDIYWNLSKWFHLGINHNAWLQSSHFILILMSSPLSLWLLLHL